LRRSLAALSDRVGWGEFVTLAAFFVCASGLYAFAEIVDDALEGETHRFDRTVLTALRTTADPADPVGPPWLEITFRDLTALGGHPVITSRVYLGVH
jgi:undecaprenyl-diphosphatase